MRRGTWSERIAGRSEGGHGSGRWVGWGPWLDLCEQLDTRQASHQGSDVVGICLRTVIQLGMSAPTEVEAKSPRGWEGPGGGADLDGGRGEDASPAAGALGAKAVLLLLLGSGVSQGLCLVSFQQPCGIGWVSGVLYPFYRRDC